MSNRDSVINDLNVAKLILCNPQMLTPEMCIKIGQAITSAISLLKEQKAVTGKWIPVTNSRGGMECSICHDYAPSYQSGAEYLSKYCPNCGTKMEGR